jgi:hypothetical protein
MGINNSSPSVSESAKFSKYAKFLSHLVGFAKQKLYHIPSLRTEVRNIYWEIRLGSQSIAKLTSELRGRFEGEASVGGVWVQLGEAQQS